MSALRETEPRPQEKPFLRFVFVSHHRWPDNPEPLLSAFDDVNVIFLETVGATTEQREILEAQYNLILARPQMLDEENSTRQEYYCSYIHSSSQFADQLVFNLRQTGKQLYLVDVDENHPAYLQIMATNKMQADMMSQLRDGNIPEGRALYKKMQELKGARNRTREEVVAEQVNQITNELVRNGQTVRAAVVQGSVHIRTPDHINQQAFTVEAQTFSIELTLQATLNILSTRGEHIPDELFDRSLLADFLLIEATSGEPEQEFKRVTELVESLTPSEVTAALEAFTHDYPIYLNRITGGRHLTEAEKKNFAPFVFQTIVRNLLKTLEAKN